MSKSQTAKGKRQDLQWHPALFGAIQLELDEYKNDLEFTAEYNLTLSPLQIDILIVKTLRNILIKKVIAKIFRTYNIIEYKSPSDYFAVQDFYQVHSYATLYIVKNNVNPKDISITLIGSKYPRELFNHIKRDSGYRIEKAYSGIYYILGGMFAIQFIVAPSLKKKDAFWLSNLRSNLNRRDISQVLRKVHPKTKDERVKMYTDVLYKANLRFFKEKMNMLSNKEFKEALEMSGWSEHWIAKGRAQGVVQGEARGMRKVLSLLRSGCSLQEVEKMIRGKKRQTALA